MAVIPLVAGTDATTRSSNRALIQAANVAGAAQEYAEGTFDIDYPVPLVGAVSVTGKGMHATTIRCQYGPPFVVGLLDAPGGQLPAADGRVAAAGVLDGTEGAGRQGLRLAVGEHAAWVGTDLDCPPAGWHNIQKLTVEVCVRTEPGATDLPDGDLCGLSDQSAFSPWRLFKTAGRIRFQYQVQGIAADQVFSCPVPPQAADRVWRIAAQVDFTSTPVKGLMIVNGFQRDTSLAITPPTGSKFKPNDSVGFTIAGASDGLFQNASGPAAPPAARLTWYGLRVAAAAPYTDVGAGNAQSGGPATDGGRYFTSAGGTLAYLHLADPAVSRMLPLITGGFLGQVGWLASPNHGDISLAWISDNQIEKIKLVGGLAVGAMGGLDLDRVWLTGGACGIYTLNGLVSYPTRLRGCRVDGTTAAIRMMDVTVQALHTTVLAWGRWAVLVKRSCFSTHGMIINDARVAVREGVIWMKDGILAVQGLNVDNEDTTNPTVAAVRHTAVGGENLPNLCSVGDVVAGFMPAGVPAVLLDGAAAGSYALGPIGAAPLSDAGAVQVTNPLWQPTAWPAAWPAGGGSTTGGGTALVILGS